MKSDAPVHFLATLLDAFRPLQATRHVPPSYPGPQAPKPPHRVD